MKLFAFNLYSISNANRNYNHRGNNLLYRSFSLKVNFDNTKICFQSKSNLELFRSYLVFQICRSKFLVTNSEFLLNKSYQILGDNITNMFLKLTFFGHFCAGNNYISKLHYKLSYVNHVFYTAYLYFIYYI